MPETHSALETVYSPGRHGRTHGRAGITIHERRGMAIVQVSAWEGDGAAQRAALGSALSLSVPSTPGTTVSDGTTTVLWGGPARWLVTRPSTNGWDLERELADALSGRAAAVVDVSQGRTVVRVSGPSLRHVLAKGCRVDLTPDAFQAGHVILAPIGHVAAVVHLVDDTPTADVMVSRSVGVSFWEWLEESAADVGCEVVDPTA